MRVATYFLEDGREIDIMKGADSKYYTCDPFARSQTCTGKDNFPTYGEVQEEYQDAGTPPDDFYDGWEIGDAEPGESQDTDHTDSCPWHNAKPCVCGGKAEEFNSQLVFDLGSNRADDRIVVLKLSDTRFYAGYVVGYDRTSGSYHETQERAEQTAREMDSRRRSW